MNAVILFIIGIPLVEIYLMIKVGGMIGAFNTILLIFFTAITGVYFAKMAGYPKPILHGLCSYGVACRSIVEVLCEKDSKKLKRFNELLSEVPHQVSGDSMQTSG